MMEYVCWGEGVSFLHMFLFDDELCIAEYDCGHLWASILPLNFVAESQM